MKKIFNHIITFLSLITFLCLAFLGTFLFFTLKDVKLPVFTSPSDIKYSKILDENDNVVSSFYSLSQEYVAYKDLPSILINALLSIEDNEYFYHNGFNPKRIISAFVSNLNPSSWTQGGSTLTQQLIKNVVLTNEKTLKRKVKEAYIAFLIEQNLSKEEILEAFFNHIYFEESLPGISYASKKFFGKSVSSLNYVECALLVGLIKSPSSYHPIRHPLKAYKRKNAVLLEMLKNNVITYDEYNIGISYSVEDLLYKQKEKDISYPYQAYFDVVYKEVKDLTSLDPFLVPLEIKTYIDTSLQTEIDKIQSNEYQFIEDPLLDIGGVVMNKKGMITGICGGRNYNGKKLFSNAYDIKVNPASTMKPIFSYLLALEHLSYNSSTILKDEPYTYFDGTSIHNADKKYLGKLTLLEALGYSRNTTAVSTLSLLKEQLGEEKLISYLRSINLFDEGNFSLSYALGGMTYGTNPINVAGAYALLINKGCYNKATTIKSIKRLDTNQIIYTHQIEDKQIISEESAAMMSDILQNVINKNYYSIQEAKPSSVIIGGKTGTNPYYYETCKKYGYPINSDKDIWFSGFSSSYVTTIWSGYKTPTQGEKAYFKSGSKDRKVSKKIFKKLMETVCLKNEEFEIPPSLKKVKVVKGTGGQFAPNPLIDDFYCEYILLPKNQYVATLPYPEFEEISSLNMILLNNEINIIFPSSYLKNELYENIFGKQGYKIKVTSPSGNITSYFITSNNFLYQFEEEGNYTFEIVASFETSSITSSPYSFSFLYRQ